VAGPKGLAAPSPARCHRQPASRPACSKLRSRRRCRAPSGPQTLFQQLTVSAGRFFRSRVGRDATEGRGGARCDLRSNRTSHHGAPAFN